MLKENVTSVCNQSKIRVLACGGIVADDVGALAASLGGFVAVFAGERVHHLACKDKRCRAVVIFESHFPGGERFVRISRAEDEHFSLAVFLREAFEQANLSFVFDGLVRRAVFAHAEAVVRKHVLDRETHESGHADSGLHEVAEHEERCANRIETVLEGDTVRNCAHREFSNTDLNESTLEITSTEDTRSVEESLRIVGVRKVSGTANDVVVIFGEVTEDRTASDAGGNAFLNREIREVELDALAREPFVECCGLFGVFLVPCSLNLLPFGNFLTEFFGAGFKASLHIIEHQERIIRITTKVLDCCRGRSTGSVERLSMRRDSTFVALAVFGDSALRHRGVAEHERRLFLLGPGGLESLAEFGDIRTVALDNAEAPGFILTNEVVAHHVFGLAAQLHLVCIIKENEIRKLEVAGDTAHAVGDFFFETAVRNEANRLVFENRTEAFDHEAFGDSRTESNTMTDTEGARGVFDTESDIEFRVAWSAAAELAEVLHVIKREAVGKDEFGIKKRTHVPRIHEETITSHPVGVVRIEAQKFGKQKRNGIGGAHSSTRMPRLGLLHHRGRKNTDVVSCFCN